MTISRGMTFGAAVLTAAVGLPGVAAAHTAGAAPPRPVGASSPRPGATFHLRSGYGGGGECLDADANAGGNGTKVQSWACNDSPQQTWIYTGERSLVNAKFPAMCLDADTNGGGRDGTKVQLWTCNHQAQQRWVFRDNDLAIYNDLFLNDFNTVVDRDTNGPGNGAQIQLWRKNFQPQQWWYRY